MGDWCQSAVDRDATEFESLELGEQILQWLIDEEIVSADATDCVHGSDIGYPPGSMYHKATGCADDHLLRLRANGLNVVTKRTVFHSGQGGFELVCSACSNRFAPPEDWSNAVGEWYENKGSGLLACPQCGKFQSIDEWEHDPSWGFATLGFEFWNWPPLTDDFVKQLGDRLGHRVVLIAGKL